jgi:signal transduction histidine kinase/ligand-binding sensor domain-containing protein
MLVASHRWSRLRVCVSALLATAALESCAASIEALPFWQPNLSHTAWTARDGAPSDAGTMLQDRNGMLWFGAPNGLFRFDGVRFERIDEISGNKLLSPNVQALALFGDALWVGYNAGGISVFEHGTVRHYGEAQGVPAGRILEFIKTADGTLWMSSHAGIYWLDGARWRQVGPDDGLPTGERPSINLLHDGGLLITHPAGLFRSVPGTHRFRKVDTAGSMLASQVQADGKVIVMKFGETPRLFNPVTETSSPLRLPASGGLPYSVHRDRRNGWWIGPGDGMRLYTPDFVLKKQFLAPYQFSAARIFTPPFDDREGNLWFMTENGIDRIRENHLSVQAMPEGSTDFIVTAGPDGEVWINSHSSRQALSPPTFAIARDGRRIASDMPSATASTRAVDGTLWFGNPHQLWRWRDGKQRRWPLPPALIQQPVQAMAMGDEGQLWLSILRRGVYTFKDGVWQAGGGHAALTGRTALSVHRDAQGRIWFGYTSNAITMLDHGKLRQFGPADGLAVGSVTTMFSGQGTLWIGGELGLAHWRNGRFIPLNDSNGQPFNGVSGIVQTAQGELWLHGPDGLVRIGAADVAAALAGDLDRVSAERFGYLDGHEGATASVPSDSLIESGDGRLWYATSSSVGWIDPRHITRNPVRPTPLITSLSINNRRYPAVNDLGLPQGTHNLRVDFTAAVLSIPERARFRTRLIGQDHEWQDAGALRQGFYTNLGPGDYRFEVMAANEDGLWSAAPASLSFHIAPAFYQALWFKLMCAALLAGGVYLLYLRRLAYLTARAVERMRTRLEERERIARTLHDTFLQSVQSLILRFHSIKAVLPKNAAVQQQIDAALDAADTVADEGRDQLMGLRVHYGGGSALAPVLKEAGVAAATQYGVEFSLSESGTQRALQVEVGDELFAIGREAVANALRHSGSAQVLVQLIYDASSFTMEVRDHGKGLDDEVRQTGHRDRHWGLTGMQERAARIGGKLAIHSKRGEGTTIVVKLPASLAYR